jgi:hypothetical protein
MAADPTCEVCARVKRDTAQDLLVPLCRREWRGWQGIVPHYIIECYRIGFERIERARAEMVNNLAGWVAING